MGEPVTGKRESAVIKFCRTEIGVIVIKKSNIPGCVIVSYNGREYHVSETVVKLRVK